MKRQGLPRAADVLYESGLKDRIRLVASGKLVTSARAAWALCVGADFVNTARGFMFSLGCIQALRCHTNTCPTGITTHNPRLQRGPSRSRLRNLVAPQLLDQPISGHDRVRAEQQQRQQRTLRAGERNERVAVGDLQGTEDSKLHLLSD